jgi:hypothetical protein
MVSAAGAEDVHGGALGHGRGAGAPDEHVQVLPLGRHGDGLRLRRVSSAAAAACALLLVPRRSSASLGGGADDVEEVGVVEAGPARGGVARRLQRVDLHAGEVGHTGLHGLGVRVRARGLGARAGGLAHGDAHPPGVPAAGGDGAGAGDAVGLELDVPPGERDDVGVDAEGDDGRGGAVGELVEDERSRGAVLEEEEHERVPDDALEDDDLDHERAGRRRAVHASQQWDAHDERVGERGEGEERDAPVEPERARGGEAAGGQRQQREDGHLLQRVGGQEAQVHGEGVVGGDEVEGEERHGEERHETVDPGALVRREDAPPADGAVRQRHGHVQRHHRRQHVVEVQRGDHGRGWLVGGRGEGGGVGDEQCQFVGLQREGSGVKWRRDEMVVWSNEEESGGRAQDRLTSSAPAKEETDGGRHR